MKVLIICQARMASTRLPGKVLLPLAGKPLLERFMERIGRSKYGANAVVATTTDQRDDVIEVLCQHLGIDVMRGHPTDLLDRHYQTALERNADVVVKIPSDCPLIDPCVIDDVIDAHLRHVTNIDYTSNLHPATFPDGNDVEVMSIHALHRAWQSAAKPFQREHTTPWMWDDNPDIKCQNVTWSTGQDMSMSQRWTIDYSEDYIFIRAIYDALYPTMPSFGMDEILSFLMQHPEVAAINSSLVGVNWYRHHLGDLRTVTSNQTSHGPAYDTVRTSISV
ncbi:MAG: acylneuraminate cytidylyltransferase [Candidatus Kapabacteria bacterium]|nr:acylneuraminate cytidylyltransferase [Candidatus Kapabacteria bacterium]